MKTRFLDRSTPPHVITLVMMAGLAALSMNIFLPSLAGMARHFDVDYSVMQLSVSAYLGVSALLQLGIGPLSDRYGRRPVVLCGFVLFILATLGTVLAQTVEWFLFFRMGQAGIATGMVLARAVVRDMVPGAQAAAMIGYVTMGMSLAPMVGPMIGGALDEAFGWRASLAFLGLLGVAVTTLIWADMGETNAVRGGGFVAQFRQYPALFGSARFWGYTMASAFGAGAYFAYLGGASFVGGEVFRLSPGMIGFFFAAPAIGYAMGSFTAGRFSSRFGIDRMILAGSLFGTSALLLALLLASVGIRGPQIFFPAIGLMTFGNALVLPNAVAGMMSVRPALAGTASGLGGALNIGGGAMLAAIAGALLHPGATEQVLLAIMAVSSLIGVATILWVMRLPREG